MSRSDNYPVWPPAEAGHCNHCDMLVYYEDIMQCCVCESTCCETCDDFYRCLVCDEDVCPHCLPCAAHSSIICDNCVTVTYTLGHTIIGATQCQEQTTLVRSASNG